MSFLPKCIRLCLKIRYRIHIEGDEILKKYKDTSILFLSNHPATIDPVIVLSTLSSYIKLRPLVAETFFKSPFILFFLKKLGALPVPEFENGNNEYKAYKVKRLLEEIKTVLGDKEKVLLYPAGHIADGLEEKIGGASLAFNLRSAPKKMIGIAIDGLCGSIFSRYFEKATAPFLKMLARGIKIALANGLFFLPKREVYIRIFEMDASLAALEDKQEFNKALEGYFKGMLELPLQLISYGICKSPQVKQKNAEMQAPLDPVLVNELICLAEKVTQKKIGLEDHFSYDVGVDSLELAEILAYVEQKYQFRLDHTPQTLKELGYYLQNRPQTVLKSSVSLAMRKTLPIDLMSEKNLLSAFFQQARRAPFRRMGCDLTLGSISYYKAVMMIKLLAGQIKALEGPYIGIVLPSSLMAYLLMLGTVYAGKVPVLLNWTGGRKSLDFAIDLLDIRVILSSEKFLEKAFNVDLGKGFDKLCLLETLKTHIGLKDKLKVMISSLFLKHSAQACAKRFNLNDLGCILFTSGSESAPKAVPLTQGNILANIGASIKTGLIKEDDRFLATLPPFHSFGAVISGYLPLLTGLDTVYLPDPTDSVSIKEGIKNYKATLFCSAPSFLKQVLALNDTQALSSLRLVVVGAEKCPDSCKKTFAQLCPHAQLLEGYGITECSPIVTLQRNPITPGVGIPLPGVEVMIVDPESLTPLGFNVEGEILVSGKSVFSGYLGIKKNPFVEIDHKLWYRSGDRGQLTSHRELILGGRFKRFIKISAEMISLGALEETLETYRTSPEGLAQFALVADPHAEKLILVSIHPGLDIDDVNYYLREHGMPKVAKISAIKTVQVIPQLATGKIDYRALEHDLI